LPVSNPVGRIVVFEEVRDDDIDALVRLDIARGLLGQFHAVHVPTFEASKVKQQGAAAANVHYRRTALDLAPEEFPRLAGIAVERVIEIIGADVCFGVLRLVNAAVDIVIPQSAITAAVIAEVAVKTVAHPERQVIAATETTGINHN
jgi:hypothetical protein